MFSFLVGRDCECIVTPVQAAVMKGEVSVLRYFSRQYGLFFDDSDRADAILDMLHSEFVWRDGLGKINIVAGKLEAMLKKSSGSGSGFLSGAKTPNLADLLAYSLLKGMGKLPPSVTKWFQACKTSFASAPIRGKNHIL